MARTVLQDVDRVLATSWYRSWARVHVADDKKVQLERAGKRRPLSGDPWARTFIEAIRVGHDRPAVIPPDPPDPPPVAYKQVAPRVAYKAGGSDARFCLQNQPGVKKVADNHWVDDAATYDDNGLCKDGRRSDSPAVTSALEIDGRELCALPTIGEPLKNTGSWAI